MLVIGFVRGGFPQAVVSAGEQDQVAVMGQSSNQCSRHLFVIKDIDPSGEFEIRVQDHLFLFVDLRHVIKQQLRTHPVIRHVTEFIQDQDFCFIQFFKELLELLGTRVFV